ncbi:galactose mutarotase [Aquiflexum sp. TKW24L]|uniref:aldose epimerase family protein n=1 Tax=Aquiflexum sp. TKW24L TaxID=2942212 RepID=UPI0020BFEAD8|nr:aldose epimerase family protein [Aquiflexum sp. TKW24L]MCL6260850.1 galactose mutarotase [Aquiflexum sp. TKW24L]
MQPLLTSKTFGFTPKGEEIHLFTLSIPNQIEISVMNYGATWTHLLIPDRNGKMEDVVLGFDTLEGYLQKDYQDHYCYIGSTVGRIAGRITGNQFHLDGKTYELPANLDGIHLHGGMEGWDRKVWKTEPFETQNSVGVTFYYQSQDGEENYPGTIDIWVTYTLDETGRMEISYQASSDKKTILNPTNHAYFNLTGDFSKTIEEHGFFVDAENYLPMNKNSLPTGEIANVGGTPFDFRNLKTIQEPIQREHPQLQIAEGIDHCFVLKQPEDCAVLYDPESGRKLTLSTTEPGIQVYTGNYLGNNFKGKNGVTYGKRTAICLETQHFPDSCNQPDFPSILLMPEEIFESRTQFVFTAE